MDDSRSGILSADAFDLTPWDESIPFPFSAQQCLALCRGDLVAWHGTVDDILTLPFRCELLDGWLMLKRR